MARTEQEVGAGGPNRETVPSRQDELERLVLERRLVNEDLLDRYRAEQRRVSASGRPPPHMAQLLLRDGVVEAPGLVELLREIHRRLQDPVSGLLQAPPADRQTTPPAQIDLQQIDRYTLVRKIARGGMAVVYEAIDTKLKRLVALKVLTDPRSHTHVERFQREARIAARLSHPNIIPIHEVGSAEDPRTMETLHYIAMDYIEGGTLAESAPGLPLTDRLELVEQVAEAAGYAHGEGAVHRDLKPANVMISFDRRAIVGDFGLAVCEWETERLTASGAVLGTLNYMSPEQVLGQVTQIDARTDVWALGVMLYQMLTGRLPFDGSSSAQVYQQILVGEPLPPRQAVSGVSRDIEIICMKALEKTPARRYANGREFAEDLRRSRSGEVLLAVPPSRLYRIRKWIGRHRVLLGMTVAMQVLGVLIFSYFEWRAWSKRRDAELVIVRRARELWTELDKEIAALERRDRSPSQPLQFPNGERNQSAVVAWYAAHAEAAELIDHLAELDRWAPGERAKRAIDRARVERRRADVCRRVWKKAAELGDDNLARSWIGRAGASLGQQERSEALAWVASIGRRRTEEALEQAKRILDSAREPLRDARPGWFEFRLNRLVRLKRPALVRLLLKPVYLDSENRWMQRLAIDALGRIGDNRTTGPEGKDPVEALTARLARIDPEAQPEIAVSLAMALGFLGDSRAHDVLDEKRRSSRKRGAKSNFWERTAVAYARIPLPARYRLGGSAEPRTANEFTTRGRKRWEKGNWRGAIEDYTRAIELDPNHYEAHWRRGDVRRLIKDLKRARADLDRAVKIEPEQAAAYQLRGIVLRALGDEQRGMDDLGRAVELDPKSVPALISRGNARSATGDLAGAREDLTRAIELDPKNSAAFTTRGDVRRRQGDLEGARADCDRAITLNPNEPIHFSNRAIVRLQLGDSSGALADFNQAIQLDPRQLAAHLGRGIIYLKVRRNFERAKADFDRVIELESDNFSGYYYRGLLQEAKGEIQDAIKDLTRAIALKPRIQESHTARGRARRAGGDLQGAAADFGRAIELAPRSWQARLALAETLHDMGRRELALAELKRALPLAPDSRKGAIRRMIQQWESKSN